MAAQFVSHLAPVAAGEAVNDRLTIVAVADRQARAPVFVCRASGRAVGAVPAAAEGRGKRSGGHAASPKLPGSLPNRAQPGRVSRLKKSNLRPMQVFSTNL